MLNEHELSLKYAPLFYADKNEPFTINKIGYSVIYASGKSPSFERMLSVTPDIAFVLEYAIFFDFDIQHMYDLEHVWVYVNDKGAVVNGESSAHGGIWNCYRLTKKLEYGVRMHLYFQPGKHAILPDGALSLIFPNYEEACGVNAGKDGLLITKLFQNRITKSAEIDKLVHEYIRKNYQFVPSLEYVPSEYTEDSVIPMNELLDYIPKRIDKLLRKIKSERNGYR